MEQNSSYHTAKKNIKGFAVSPKAIVANEYEELAEPEAYSI